MSKRRKFSADFKRGAVEQAKQPGVSCAQVTRELGIRGDYQDYLAAHALACSMSAVGHCGDNAACEGFFALLKRERIYRTKYPTLDATRADVFEYIERLHNPRMRRR